MRFNRLTLNRLNLGMGSGGSAPPQTPALEALQWTLTSANTRTSREGFGTLDVTIDTGARPGIIAVRWTDQAGKDPVSNYGTGVEPTVSIGGGVYRLSSLPDELGNEQFWHESSVGVSRTGIRIFVLEANKGWSEVSVDTKAATPATVPSAPEVSTITVAATGTSNELEVSLSVAPATGGSAITGYQVQVDGGSWATLSGDPTSAAQTFTAASGAERSVRVRAVNANGSGWESLPVLATPTDALWTPSVFDDVVVWDARTGVVESGGTVTTWTSRIARAGGADVTPLVLTGAGATYDGVNFTVDGTGAIQNPLGSVTLPFTVTAANGITVGLLHQDATVASALAGSSSGAYDIAAGRVFSVTSTGSNGIAGAGPRIAVVTGVKPTPEGVTNGAAFAYNAGTQIWTGSIQFGLTANMGQFRPLGHQFHPAGYEADAKLQIIVVVPRVLTADERYRLEGWLKFDGDIGSGITLNDGSGSHDWNATAPTLGETLSALDTGIPESSSDNTAVSGTASSWTATNTEAGTLRAAKKADVTPLTPYRLTATVTAPLNEPVAVRVGRTALLWQDTVINNFNDFSRKYIAEKMVIGTGSPVSVTMDFVAPSSVIFAGVVRPNGADGLAVTVADLSLATQPETVAIGATTTTDTIEHDGVVFKVRHSVSGNDVTVGRYAVDGQYWVLNPNPTTDPVEVWQTEVVGRGVGMLDVVHDSYASWGTISGVLQSGVSDKRSAVEGGCMIDTFWRRADLPGATFSIHTGQGFHARTNTDPYTGDTVNWFLNPVGGHGVYHLPSNVEPSRTGKPIVFDNAGTDWTEESDRISAAYESTLIKQVPLDLLVDTQGRARTSHFVTLTVVESTPNANDFRPPSVRRGDKSSVGLSTAVDVSRVPAYSLPTSIQSSLPAASEIIYRLRRPIAANTTVLPFAMSNWPISFGGAYPRELTESVAEMFFVLVSDQTSSSDREVIIKLMTQHAIDISAYVVDTDNNPCSPDGESIGIYGPFMLAAAGASQLSWITAACDSSLVRLPEVTGIGRVPQAWADRETPAFISRDVGFNEKNASPSFSPAMVGQVLWLQRTTDGNAQVAFGESPYWGDALAHAGAGAPYRKQNETGFGAPIEIAGRIGAAGFRGKDYWGDSAMFELWPLARHAELRAAPTLISGDVTLATERTFFSTFGESNGPLTGGTWGLDHATYLGSNGVAYDSVPVIRPCYPSDSGVWLNTRTHEFCGALLTSPGSLTFSVLGATTFGEVTTGALPSGFSLNTSTGEISVNGTQTAGSLQWVGIRATDGSGRTADTAVAIQVAEAYLRALVVRDNEPTQMVFGAEVQTETGLGGTIHWVLYGGETKPTRVVQRLFARPTAANIIAGEVPGETVISAGSFSVSGNGFTPTFSPSGMEANKMYGISVLFTPDTETAPDPIHESYVSQSS